MRGTKDSREGLLSAWLHHRFLRVTRADTKAMYLPMMHFSENYRRTTNHWQSVSPFLSSDNYDKIRRALMLKHGVVDIKPKSNIFLYLSWAASILLLIGIGYQYKQLDDKETRIVNVETEKSKLQKSVVDLQLKNKESEEALALVRDNNNIVIALAGQEVSPESFAKAYWNKNTKTVHIDASGLPEPPEGMVYQVWALKLNPLTPTSIGLLDNFKGNAKKIFAVENAN
ncbi:MAG: anti-sigma factor, partial [Proteobacteria bacterium]